jgi:DNA-binding MarR family transcriptional regulator
LVLVIDGGLSEQERQVWRSFRSVTTRLTERLDHELQQRSQLSMTDFDILSMLSEAPERRLRMSELADQVMVSRSRLTYRVDRLTELDLVNRQECEDDRRGMFAILTDTGAEALAQAAPGHHHDVQTLFLSAIDEDDLAAMGRLLARVDDNLATS